MMPCPPPRVCLREELQALVRRNGGRRELLQRFRADVASHRLGSAAQEQQQGADQARRSAAANSDFCADLVLRKENGFELWLGSLEDALSLGDLCELGFDGLLNCALGECQGEVSVFQRSSSRLGRRRCHARGPSAFLEGQSQMMDIASLAYHGCRTLDRDEIRSRASFDGEWYSTMLEKDVAYGAFNAVDEDGYRMDEHFEEVVSFLEACREEGRRVLVHCIAGINRSAASLVAFLCSAEGMTLREAVDLVSRRRGGVLSNTSFLDQLIERFGADCSTSADRSSSGSSLGGSSSQSEQDFDQGTTTGCTPLRVRSASVGTIPRGGACGVERAFTSLRRRGISEALPAALVEA